MEKKRDNSPINTTKATDCESEIIKDGNELKEITKKLGFCKKASFVAFASSLVLVFASFASIVAGSICAVQSSNLDHQKEEMIEEFKASEEYKKIYQQHIDKYSAQLASKQITTQEHNEKVEQLDSQEFIESVSGIEVKKLDEKSNKKFYTATGLVVGGFAGVGVFQAGTCASNHLAEKANYYGRQKDTFESRKKEEEEKSL